MRAMRRSERNITDPSRIADCLQDSPCLHVGFYDQGEIYIVPVNFGYSIQENTYTLYFHGAKAGRKAELAASHPVVGFEMETNLSTVSDENPCDFSELFLSIIGNGKLSILSDLEEKKTGLNLIMKKASGKENWEFPEAALNATNVYKIEVTELSCKEH